MDRTEKQNGNMPASFEDGMKIEKLNNSESYQIWKFQIVILFKSHGLWEIVNAVKKLETITDERKKAVFFKKNAFAQKLIMTSVERKLLMHIFNCTDAHEMLSKLKNFFI